MTLPMIINLGETGLVTTSVPDAQIPLSHDMALVFSLSPFSAVRPRQTSEFLML